MQKKPRMSVVISGVDTFQGLIICKIMPKTLYYRVVFDTSQGTIDMLMIT